MNLQVILYRILYDIETVSVSYQSILAVFFSMELEPFGLFKETNYKEQQINVTKLKRSV